MPFLYNRPAVPRACALRAFCYTNGENPDGDDVISLKCGLECLLFANCFCGPAIAQYRRGTVVALVTSPQGTFVAADSRNHPTSGEIRDDMCKIQDDGGTRFIAGLCTLLIEEFMAPVEKVVRSHFITARAAARRMIEHKSGVIIFVTGSPVRPHVPGASAIGAAFAALENLTCNLAFEVSPLGVRVVCLRTVANIDSRSIQDTLDFLAARMKITKEQAVERVALQNFLKVPATAQDTANAAVLIASDSARMMTGTVVNASAGAALD
jgi:NAD(P)-dependent dehydrogenase (short-subunit alcohol dehydrogenase family)